jgi:predicted RNase H-like nuclease (RuvC/YqgF family)
MDNQTDTKTTSTLERTELEQTDVSALNPVAEQKDSETVGSEVRSEIEHGAIAPESTPNVTPNAASLLQADLQTALETSQANEAILQRKIEALEAELAAQQTQIDQLKAEAAAAAQFKAELDETKRVIMQLTELNAKLSEEAKTAAVLQPLAPAAAQPASQTTPQATGKAAPVTLASAPRKEVHPGHEPSQTSQLELRRTLQSPPPLPGPVAPSISNDEIGWVD